METIKTLYMDLLDRDKFGSQILHAKQGESNTRKACLELYAAGAPWAIPEGASVALRYQKLDKTGGMYDALPGTDSPAYTIAENRQSITWTIAPQVLTCAGLVVMDMLVVLDDQILATFSWSICVEAGPLSGSQLESQDYFHCLWVGGIDATLSLPGMAADAKATGEKLSGVQQTANEACMVADDAKSMAQTAQEKAENAQSAAEAAGQRAEEAWQLANEGGGGINSTAVALLIQILRNATYDDSADQTANITALEKALATSGGGDEPVEPDEPVDPEATIVNIVASYTGGDVAVGTALSALTGISVMAVYSDGSTVSVTNYSLSGEIAEGDNIITVTYEGLTATFIVTGYDASLEVIDFTKYLKKENSELNTFYMGNTIRWTDQEGVNIYSVPVTAGTYRFAFYVDNSHTAPRMHNMSIKDIVTGKLPLMTEDTDLSSNSIFYTDAESCSYIEHGVQEDGKYLWTLDVAFASDGYFLFSVNPDVTTFSKVVA